MSRSTWRKVAHGADRTIWWMTTIGGVIAACATVGIMFLTAADVFHREFIGGSIRGSVERSAMLLIVTAFLGLGVTQREGQHVASELFVDWLPERPARVVQAIGLLIAVGMLTWVLYATGTRAWESFQERESRFGLVVVPVWPGRVAIAVGLALMLLETMRQCAIQIFARDPEAALASPKHGEGLA